MIRFKNLKLRFINKIKEISPGIHATLAILYVTQFLRLYDMHQFSIAIN